MTQKKQNSIKSRNGELRALENFSGIVIFSKLEIIRVESVESLFWLESSREVFNYFVITLSLEKENPFWLKENMNCWIMKVLIVELNSNQYKKQRTT